MLERVEQRYGITPKQLIGDTAYGTDEALGWLVDDKHIARPIPVWDKSRRADGTFSIADFSFDADQNRYQCPAGKFLKPSRRTEKKNPFNYRASLFDCQPCPLKAQCCPNARVRRIVRRPHESCTPSGARPRDLATTDAYRAVTQRSQKS